jgi:predicted metal-dependent peptidase
MSRHSSRAGPALRALAETDPAMAALSLWCDHRDDVGPVARTAGTMITYGPGFEALPRHEQTGIAAHHILHVALRHSARMAAMDARFAERFDADLYAIAADAVVNEALVQSGYAIPRPALTLTGLLADLDGAAAPAAEALAVWDTDRLYIRLTQQASGADRAADRAKAHVRVLVFEPDLDPTVQRSEAAEGVDEALWRQHLSRAMEAGRLAGRGIGMLGHRLADIPVAETPWEVVLRRLVTRSLTEAAQPTYRRPARRWVAMEAEARRNGGPSPAFEPGVLRRLEVPRVVVGLDASSSIDDARLGMVLAEIAGIVRRLAAEVWVIAFDETPRGAVRIDPTRWRSQLEQLDLPRGGGTDFGPVIAAAARLRPSVIVILTDMEGTVGPRPGSVPVIWAVPDGAPPAPPFGRVISLAR